MVLSNVKLKRKKREEAAAATVLNPPPDSNATPSFANDVKSDCPALHSKKKKKKKKPLKSKVVNVDAIDGMACSFPEGMRDTDSITEVSVEGNVIEGVPVQKCKKELKTASEVGLPCVTPMEVEDVESLPAVGDAGVSEQNVLAGPGQERAPVTKTRKKPRWELNENGKRVRPQKVRGGGDGPFNGAKASTSSDKVTAITDVINVLVEKNVDSTVAAPDTVNNGDRIFQGDEPWLQSKRSKKKKKLTDRGAKNLNDAEAVVEVHAANQKVPQAASSTEEKVDPKKVMVGGMSYYVSEGDIYEYFQECGSIVELDCMTFPDIGKFKGIAFITFRTEEAAKRALALDGPDIWINYMLKSGDI